MAKTLWDIRKLCYWAIVGEKIRGRRHDRGNKGIENIELNHIMVLGQVLGAVIVSKGESKSYR